MYLMAFDRSMVRCGKKSARSAGHDGFTLIEILVTILILMLGLLGVISLQARASNVEFESYQRGQALSLAREMAARIGASRGIVSGFLNAAVSSTNGSVYLGNGGGAASFVDADNNCTTGLAALDKAKFEACQWGQALQGAAVQEAGNNVGAMIGARGCLIRVEPANNNAIADLYVVIVWQALKQGNEPLGMAAGEDASPASQCASGVNFGAGLRRGVSVRVMVPDLNKIA
jgi:type IV pilus assembly protein PilV